MKNVIIILICLILFIILPFQSCDDSSVIPPPAGTTRVSFDHTLKNLDVNRDGSYELWLVADSASIIRNLSYGKFNMDGTGKTLDLNGNYKDLIFPEQYRTLVPYIGKSFLTIEPPGDNDTNPSQSILVSGEFQNYYDTISARLTMMHPDAFGSVAEVLHTGIRSRFMSYTVTSNDSNDCLKAIWFCDKNGTSYFYQGLDLTNNPGWKYEGWVINKTTGATFSTGKFSNPYAADEDGAGPCAGPNPGYNAPGQEWIISGCADIENIQNKNYKVYITLEPKFEYLGSPGFDKPFFLYPYFNDPIQPEIGCGREENLYNIFNYNVPGYPKVYVRISKGPNSNH